MTQHVFPSETRSPILSIGGELLEFSQFTQFFSIHSHHIPTPTNVAPLSLLLIIHSAPRHTPYSLLRRAHLRSVCGAESEDRGLGALFAVRGWEASRQGTAEGCRR